MTKPLLTKYILMMGIIGSLALISFKIPHMIVLGTFSGELPFICLAGLIICSPYLYLLKRLRNLRGSNYSAINLLNTSLIITLPAIIILFLLIYVYPDPQNGLAVIALVLLQWFLCFISFLVAAFIRRSEKSHRTSG